MFLNAPVLHYLTLAVLEVYLCLIVLWNNASTPNHSRVVQILLKILSGIWRKRFKLHILPKCLKVPIRDFFSKSRIFLPLLFHHTLTKLVDSFPSPVFSGSSNTFPLSNAENFNSASETTPKLYPKPHDTLKNKDLLVYIAHSPYQAMRKYSIKKKKKVWLSRFTIHENYVD